jgi:hypothetical protein
LVDAAAEAEQTIIVLAECPIWRHRQAEMALGTGAASK